MKDFDQDRDERAKLDRRFKIGGETFVYRASVAPEAIMRWTEFASDGDRENMLLAAAQQRLQAAESMTDPAYDTNELARLRMRVADAAEVAAGKGKGEREWIELIDETALAVIDPSYRDGWEKVRSPDAHHPLSLQDLQDLMQWLIGKVVGRPTEPPSASTDTPPPEAASTSSTGDSSPPAEPVSEVSPTDEAASTAPSTPDS